MDRAAGAAVTERVGRRTERAQLGLELEPDAEGIRLTGEDAAAVGERRASEPHGLVRQQPVAAAGEHAVQACDRASRADRVRARDLGRVEGRVVPRELLAREERRVRVDGLVERIGLSDRRRCEIGCAPEPGDARLHVARQPEPELQPERLRDLIRDERAHGPAVDSADELAAEPAVRERVVRDSRAGLPVRRLRGDEAGHALVVDEIRHRDRRAESRQPRFVRDDVADEHALLPELGPVRRHRCVELELAALDQEEQTHGDESLRPREDDLDRVLAPRRPGLLVGGPAPEIDDGDAVDHGCERRAVLAALAEAALELVCDSLEARLDVRHGRRRARPKGRQKSALRT